MPTYFWSNLFYIKHVLLGAPPRMTEAKNFTNFKTKLLCESGRLLVRWIFFKRVSKLSCTTVRQLNSLEHKWGNREKNIAYIAERPESHFFKLNPESELRELLLVPPIVCLYSWKIVLEGSTSNFYGFYECPNRAKFNNVIDPKIGNLNWNPY